MKFCTAINCMDGRVQLPVIAYLQKKFNVEYVDIITEAGPNKILSERNNAELLESILYRLNISIEKHNSVGIAITGHYDCAGNPADYNQQIIDIKNSIQFLQKIHEHTTIIGLWIDKNWQVSEID